MDVKELRVGNYIAWRSFYSSPEAVGIINGDEDSINGVKACYFNGIPLTEEWLKEFGFDIEDGIWIKQESGYARNSTTPINQRIKLIIRDRKVLIYYDYDTDIEAHNMLRYIRYVHQLQNLFFDLVGRELKTE